MNYRIYIIAILSAMLAFTKVNAQEILTLEEAIRITLENNYDIKLFSNNKRIGENNVTLGNAGFLPVVNGTLTNNNSRQNSTQTLQSGVTQERNGAKNSNLNYGVGLNWTIFDGFGMFARYDQLQEFEKLNEAELQLTILSRVGDVMSVFYNLVQQQQQLRAFDTALYISKVRLNTAQARFEIGRAARLEVLNAQVDFNTDTTNMLRQKELYRNTQIQLNELLARDVNILFSVPDSILIDDKLTLEQLTSQAANQNPSLKSALINKRIAELDRKQIRSLRYPSLTLNSGYNFTNATSALGFATQTSGRGFNYGLTASVNIFNGFNQRRNEKNASILVENAQLQFEKLNQNINAQLSSAFQTYITSLTLVKLEEVNQGIAQKNLEITMEKFRLGSISPLEIREAQLNYVNASFRYQNALYEAKLAEVALKEISGTITF